MKYIFIADGGHGWLSVPLEEIRKLGITDQISSYSYMTDTRVYLEEDSDAGKFLDASGSDINSIPYSYSDTAKCRSYASYDPKWVHEPFGIGRQVWIQDGDRQKRWIVARLFEEHYIVEVQEWVPKAGETATTKYGIPASNPLKYCTPA